MGFGSPDAAMRMRDFVASVAESVVKKTNPPARYGAVLTFDRSAYTCEVVLPGSSDPVTVTMGCVQPTTIGQKVRISTTPGDFFLESVIGPAFFVEE